MALDPLFTDEFGEVVSRTNVKLNSSFKYIFGEEEHIVKAMRDMKATNVDASHICLLQLPIDLIKGKDRPQAVIPRVIIASVTDPTKPPSIRSETVIKPVIIPFYDELLQQMTRQAAFSILGNKIEHRQRVRYGTQQAAQGFTEYIDGIEILELKIYLKQNCI